MRLFLFALLFVLPLDGYGKEEYKINYSYIQVRDFIFFKHITLESNNCAYCQQFSSVEDNFMPLEPVRDFQLENGLRVNVFYEKDYISKLDADLEQVKDMLAWWGEANPFGSILSRKYRSISVNVYVVTSQQGYSAFSSSWAREHIGGDLEFNLIKSLDHHEEDDTRRLIVSLVDAISTMYHEIFHLVSKSSPRSEAAKEKEESFASAVEGCSLLEFDALVDYPVFRERLEKRYLSTLLVTNKEYKHQNEWEAFFFRKSFVQKSLLGRIGFWGAYKEHVSTKYEGNNERIYRASRNFCMRYLSP